MRLWLPIVLLLAGCTLHGCAFSPSADVIRELAKDPATASVTILSPYGQIRWTRTNPPPGQAVTVSPDGTITVK